MGKRQQIALIALAGAGVYWAMQIKTRMDNEALGEGATLFDYVSDYANNGWGFIKVALDNVYGETMGAGFLMKPSESIKQFIFGEEGKAYKAYETKKGNGDWTIGIGHKITASEQHLKTATLNDAEVYALFEKDIVERGSNEVNRVLKADVSQPQFDALVSVVFNNYTLFRKVMPLVNAYKNEEAATLIGSFESYTGQFLKYPGLKTRRAREAAIYRSGSID